MKPAFLVDEDMPRSTARALTNAGYTASDVRDVGLRGRSDDEVFAYAQEHGLVLITADKGFANVLRFAPGTHAGIVVLRVPNETPIGQMNEELLRTVEELSGESISGLLVVVSAGRTRVRRPRG